MSTTLTPQQMLIDIFRYLQDEKPEILNRMEIETQWRVEIGAHYMRFIMLGVSQSLYRSESIIPSTISIILPGILRYIASELGYVIIAHPISTVGCIQYKAWYSKKDALVLQGTDELYNEFDANVVSTYAITQKHKESQDAVV